MVYMDQEMSRSLAHQPYNREAEENRHKAEEYDCVMMWLNVQDVLFADKDGQVYSIIGRIKRLLER